MSANGVKPHGTNYQKTKFMADEYLKNSGLNYTIFRPTSLLVILEAMVARIQHSNIK